MVSRIILPQKSYLEVTSATFTFQDQCPFGSVISGAVVSVEVWSGVDPNPMDILLGLPSQPDPYYIYQELTGGLPGVIYYLVCTVAVSGALVLTQDAYLAVVAPDQLF